MPIPLFDTAPSETSNNLFQPFPATGTRCMFTFCTVPATEERHTVFLRDGSVHRACPPHWDGIFAVLDRNTKVPTTKDC